MKCLTCGDANYYTGNLPEVVRCPVCGDTLTLQAEHAAIKALRAEKVRLQAIIDTAIGALGDNAIMSACFILSRAAHGAKLTGERSKYDTPQPSGDAANAESEAPHA